MVKVDLLKIVILVLGSYLPLVTAADKPKVTIYIESMHALDPYVTGTGKTLAIATTVQVLATSELDVNFQYASKKKTAKILDSGANACIVNKLKTTERAERYVFTNPISLYYGQRLYYMNNTDLGHDPAMADQQTVDLKNLFQTYPQKTLMLKANTSYGDKLDNILATIAEKNKRYLGANMSQTKLFQMLEYKRADFIINYPLVRAQPELSTLAVSGALIEHTNHYVLGRMMCSNTPAMTNVIDILNNRITLLHQQKSLFDIHKNTLHPADVAQFERDYAREFK